MAKEPSGQSGSNNRKTIKLSKGGKSEPKTAGKQTAAKQPIEEPGPVSEGQGSMALNTKIGFDLWSGRQAGKDGDRVIHPIVGGARFAKNVADIWRAAAADDPYADQILLEIETAWNDAMTFVRLQTKSIEATLSGMDKLNVTGFESGNPSEIPLKFHTPWGFRGALLIKDFDDLALLAIKAKRLGLIFNDDWKSIISRSSTRIRRTFELCTLWINTGVTREDVKAHNQVADRAIEIYAAKRKNLLVLDEHVLNAETRAELSPLRKSYDLTV